MTLLIRGIQVFVGVLFIVSGLVKANDPVGLSYKMQEFFELWNAELGTSQFFLRNALISLFTFLHHHSLFLSVVMITLEIVAGVALLLGWMRNFVLWLLLLLIVFFTFLTGYAYLSGKFTNCGCFGDCLPITPLTSFIKDLVLLAMILTLLAGRRYLATPFSTRLRVGMLAGSVVLALAFQAFVLQYLPVADCLPFKQGNNLGQQMLPPPGSRPDSVVIRFLYEKDGKRYEFGAADLPADLNTYKYIDRKDRVVRKGNAEPPLKGFSLNGLSGSDSTTAILSLPKAVLVFGQDFSAQEVKSGIQKLAAAAAAKGLPLYLASPSASITAAQISGVGTLPVQFFNTDFTVVRTAARTNPTVYVLENGTIRAKYSRQELDRAASHL